LKVLDESIVKPGIAAACGCIPCSCNCSGEVLVNLNTTNDHNGDAAYIYYAVQYSTGCSC